MDAHGPLSPAPRTWLRLLSLSVVAAAMLLSGCSSDPPGAPASSGSGGGGGKAGDTSLPKTDLDCTVPEAGCLCDEEGQHAMCGKVHVDLGGQMQCGKGVSTCTKGRWSECVLTGFDSLPLTQAPDGFYHTQTAAAPTPCQTNPCNPYCFNYPDGPDAGVTDSGTNLVLEDGGIGTTADAGPLPCTPKTTQQACADAGKNCGKVQDGCAGVIDCGTCTVQYELCGGGGVPNKCGTTPIAQCTPKTTQQACADAGKNCGWVQDGCGGVIACGMCGSGQTCGLGAPNVCGANCTPVTCAQLGKNCGLVNDGCGQMLNCGTCAAGQICGAYSANLCWSPGACAPKTQAQACTQAGKNCGKVQDGCGGVIDCGTCVNTQLCGGGGVPNVCGGTVCIPKTQAEACTQSGKNCGPVSDGCGGTVNCGTCPGGQTCGFNAPNVCGVAACTPKTATQACTQAGKNCGPVSDGCNGTINCGTCPNTQLCGGGGTANVCGGTVCIPKTQAQACTNAGKNCGPISDGCGGTINCGTCQQPASCGGSGVPNKCGTSPYCTNLCLQQQVCPGNGTTSITGTVYAPNGVHPLPNVVVYVPNGAVQPLSSSLTCENCATASGDPLVSTKTNTDGTFTLTNMPVGNNIPLVMQLGKWRRQVTISNVAACTNTAVPAWQTRLPRNKGEGDIPKIAVSTGCVDAMECVLRRMGIDDAEFTVPTGDGRVNFFYEQHCWGSWINYYNDPGESALLGNLGVLDNYDMVLLPCAGAPYSYDDKYFPSPNKAWQQNIATYLNSGGRAFFTHYNYRWLRTAGTLWDSPLNSAIAWNPDQYANDGTMPSTINTSFPRGDQLADWLLLPAVGASGMYSKISVNTVRRDFDGWDTGNTINWLSTDSPNFPIHLTFDTPLNVAQTSKCGRAVFSDFHVYNKGGINASTTFPGECPNTAMTAQEKLLEYMLFDLASCVGNQPPVIPPCTPQTCASQGITCGQAGNGCGGTLTCGPACPGPTCTPKTCASQGITCGQAGDGCGGILTCGAACPPPSCTPSTCAAQGKTCGTTGDGCGNTLTCGPACPVPTCTPKTCANQGLNCGSAGDGCGGTLNCGVCPQGQLCGGNGTPNVCWGACVKNTCPTGSGSYCGNIPDGCGGTMSCGCTAAGETCGGGGIPSKCGKACVQAACPTGSGAFCGSIPDGCGSTKLCGCTAPGESCGGGGVVNQCGKASCTPKSCAAQGIACGQAGDGCGNTLSCGTCTLPLTCGGGGVPGQCGSVDYHTDGYFVRDYAANCPSGTAPYWQLWSWTSQTPGDSYIDFKVQTASTEAGLATAPSDVLVFSVPPGPAVLASQPAKAHAANQPAGSPDTQVGAAWVDNTLQLNGRARNLNYLRITSHLAPTTSKLQDPLLQLWNMQVDCIPTE